MALSNAEIEFVESYGANTQIENVQIFKIPNMGLNMAANYHFEHPIEGASGKITTYTINPVTQNQEYIIICSNLKELGTDPVTIPAGANAYVEGL